MKRNVYNAWLTDRGIESPASQPFHLLGSHIDPAASVLILAQSSPDTAQETLTAVARLADALKTPQRSASWVVNHEGHSMPNLKIMRSLIPGLSHAVELSAAAILPESCSFPVETFDIASRPLRVIYGPTITMMNADLEAKRRFWNQLRTWVAE